MKSKKGDIWVSAILYFGLGIVVIAIILAAASPVINKLRDKNVILQTKEVFQVLDSNIREVGREGPGAQRPVTLDIRKGDFKFEPASGILGITLSATNSRVVWKYNSKALIAEACDTPTIPLAACPNVLEGNLKILVEGKGGTGPFKTTLSLEYPTVYVHYASPVPTITGTTPVVIRNIGPTCGPTSTPAYCFLPCPAPPAARTSNCCDGVTTAGAVCATGLTAKPTVEVVQRNT